MQRAALPDAALVAFVLLPQPYLPRLFKRKVCDFTLNIKDDITTLTNQLYYIGTQFLQNKKSKLVNIEWTHHQVRYQMQSLKTFLTFKIISQMPKYT